MAADRQRQALQTIYSFFLGLMVLALIGIAVYTVYPSPEMQLQDRMNRLQRELEPYQTKAPSTLSTADQAKRNQLQDEIDALQKQQESVMQGWARNTSIALIILATIAMVVSLWRPEQMRVLSNGLLLGGVFTMLYGVGWSIASGESWTRLIVVLFAFGVTIGLGYVKFVRMRQAPAAVAAGEAPASAELASIEERIASLESRMAAAATAFGSETPEYHMPPEPPAPPAPDGGSGA